MISALCVCVCVWVCVCVCVIPVCPLFPSWVPTCRVSPDGQPGRLLRAPCTGPSGAVSDRWLALYIRFSGAQLNTDRARPGRDRMQPVSPVSAIVTLIKLCWGENMDGMSF